ncbi:hypothetical protein JRO89_XS09G0058800 [Xanthoceras sorbifolium]|uniref:Retroviral polymerase SH3-like domain-containing protein n=1 Tax=Xanthoceras sorbifolium TaxID=99658 RepID=A0ABQ8HKK5_9ROSI|nr:hypothetical protein JRO89_XS09G0058800 [Xanthoceras sorbifolium]
MERKENNNGREVHVNENPGRFRRAGRVKRDQFGYRFYDPVHKKLLRSRDVVFVKDQTIEDNDKVEKDVSSTNGDSTGLELVPPTPVARQVRDEGQVDEPDEDDALIEAGSEDKEDDIHQPAPTFVASLVPLRGSATTFNSKAWLSSNKSMAFLPFDPSNVMQFHMLP